MFQLMSVRSSRSVSITLAVLLVALLLFGLGGEAWGCPTCKDGVIASDDAATNMARGYFYSILLMLAMPFTLAGCFGMYIWREYRRQQLAGGPDAVVRQVLEQQAKAAVAPSRVPVTAGSHAFGSHPLGSNSLGSDAC